MRRSTLAVVALLAVVGLGAAGAAFTAGVGPAPGGPDAEARLTDYPTGTAIEVDGEATAVDGDPGPPFTFAIGAIESCGRTCRDVTITLTNNREAAANDVTVLVRMYAGQDNTAREDRIWEGTADVGTLEGGESYTETKRVELSLMEGLAVERNGGWVTVVTTVRSADRTVTFTGSRQVA